jgi:hypothetical protein
VSVLSKTTVNDVPSGDTKADALMAATSADAATRVQPGSVHRAKCFKA